MRLLTRLAALVAVGVVSLAAAGCAGTTPGGADQFRVVAFTPGYSTPVAKGTLDSFVEQAKALGWRVTVVTSDFDYDKLTNEVTAAIAQGADALFSGLSDYRQMTPIFTAARDASIPIFSVDGGVVANDDFALDVTTDQEQIAELAVGALEKAMGGVKGKRVLMIGFDYHPGINARTVKARKLLEAAGAVIAGGDVKQVISPSTAQEESLKFVTDYLQANPHGLDGVWTGWDQAAVGAAQALSEAGEDTPVTGVDAVGIALDAIKKGGPLRATVMQPWPKVLTVVMDGMKAYAGDRSLPAQNFVEVGVTLVDRSNVNDVTPTDQ